ncbi:MAG TPA: FHA domain-containing protein [Kofleriaceae bacterium]|jgi:pSer/pThr/pTyr-binding forkhead associated (FHA) protein/RNA polymerase subunit RPABC4/transcription elongation factor Spt4
MDVGLVCDACSALTPIGVPQCKVCGAAVALDPRPRTASQAPPPGEKPSPTLVGAGASGVICSKCNTMVPATQKFCPNCGNKMPGPEVSFDVETRVGPRPGPAAASSSSQQPSSAKSGRSTMMFGGAHQSARAKLTLIRGDGEDGVSFTLAGDEHQAGRGDVPISFPDDPYLSPTHANFIYRKGPSPAVVDLVVRDEGSLNGVYVRINGTMNLTNGSTVLVGEQVLTVAAALAPEDLPDSEGTYFSSSMPRPATMQIVQALRGGSPGWVYRLGSETVVMGREGNDINFPEDPFISGRHAELRMSNSVLSITDLGSRNGTFVRVTGELVLRHGDYVFLGQQLLRVEIV